MVEEGILLNQDEKDRGFIIVIEIPGRRCDIIIGGSTASLIAYFNEISKASINYFKRVRKTEEI